MSDNLENAVETEAGDDRRKKVLLGGGVSLAILLGGYLFFGGGGDTEDLAAEPVSRAPRVAAAEKPAAPVKLPAAYKEQIGRDPFRALYVPPAAAAAGAPVAAPSAAPILIPIGGAPAPQAPAPAPAPVTKRYPLKLVSINPPNGEVRTTTWLVDGKRQTVLPAQRFGKFGELVVLAFAQNSDGVVDTAILQVGDDTPIEVKVGETNNVM